MTKDKPPLISQPFAWVIGVLLAVFSSALFRLASDMIELRAQFHVIDTRQQLHELRHEYQNANPDEDQEGR